MSIRHFVAHTTLAAAAASLLAVVACDQGQPGSPTSASATAAPGATVESNAGSDLLAALAKPDTCTGKLTPGSKTITRNVDTTFTVKITFPGANDPAACKWKIDSDSGLRILHIPNGSNIVTGYTATGPGDIRFEVPASVSHGGADERYKAAVAQFTITDVAAKKTQSWKLTMNRYCPELRWCK
jgi:hypothetical protein